MAEDKLRGRHHPSMTDPPTSGASSMADNNGRGDQLLDLPMELLQLICGLVKNSDKSNLRLVNKMIEAAAFDAWAKAYLTAVSWWMLSEEDLHRAHSILSHPRLAPKVRCLQINLIPTRSPTTPPAPSVDLSSVWDRMRATEKRVRAHVASSSMLQPNAPPMRSLMSLASALEVVLHLRLASGFGDIQRDQHHIVDPVIRDTLAVALQSQCRIDDLGYDPRHIMCELAMELRQHDFTTLQTLDFGQVVGFERDGAVQSLRLAVPILSAATNLRDLTLPFNEELYKTTIGDELVSACQSTKLRRVWLRAVKVSDTSLLAMLRRCQDSLEVVRLDDVELVSDNEEAWLDIFRALEKCQQVETLSCYGCTQYWQGQAGLWFDDPAEFFREFDPEADSREGDTYKSRETVAMLLDMMIEVWQLSR